MTIYTSRAGPQTTPQRAADSMQTGRNDNQRSADADLPHGRAVSAGRGTASCGCGLGPSGPARPLGLRPAGLARAYPGSSWWPGALPPVDGGGHAAAPRASWWSRCAWCGPGVRSARPRLCSVPSSTVPDRTKQGVLLSAAARALIKTFVLSSPGGGPVVVGPPRRPRGGAARGRAAGPCSVCLGAYAVAHSAPASRI